jgi:hypothetical protein
MNIRDTILPARDTLLVTMTAEVAGEDFVRWRCELSKRHDVSRLHIISDLRGYRGRIDNDDLKAVAGCYSRTAYRPLDRDCVV